MVEGFYKGPNKQTIEIRWDDGPGFNTSCLMYRRKGCNVWYELTAEIKYLLKGWRYIK